MTERLCDRTTDVTQGVVGGLYISPEAGAPMETHHQLIAIEGAGLQTADAQWDRYAVGRGFYSGSGSNPNKIRHMTVISSQAVERVSKRLSELAADVGLPDDFVFGNEQARRNVVVEKIGAEDLRRFIGRQFVIGSATFLGTEECTPCNRPGELAGADRGTSKAILQALRGYGGIRAAVIGSGRMVPGDCIYPLS